MKVFKLGCTMCFLSIMLCLATICSSTFASPADSQHKQNKPAPLLSAKETDRLARIISDAQNYGFQLTPAVHEEFWKLLDKIKLTDQEIQTQHDRYSYSNLYMRSMFQDALASYKVGYPIKSRERKIWENAAKKSALERPSRETELAYINKLFSSGDKAVLLTAGHKPTFMFGKAALLDEAQCAKSTNILNGAQTTIDDLFTRPGADKARQVDYNAADAELHFDTALDLQSKGQHDKALFELRQAIQVKPEYIPAHSQLVNELTAVGDYKAAITEARLILQSRPNEPVTHLHLGDALYKNGDKEEAHEEWRKVITFGDPLASFLAQRQLKARP